MANIGGMDKMPTIGLKYEQDWMGIRSACFQTEHYIS
jgi:hypothetical protein